MLFCENLGLSHEMEGSMAVLRIAILPSETAILNFHLQSYISLRNPWDQPFKVCIYTLPNEFPNFPQILDKRVFLGYRLLR